MFLAVDGMFVKRSVLGLVLFLALRAKRAADQIRTGGCTLGLNTSCIWDGMSSFTFDLELARRRLTLCCVLRRPLLPETGLEENIGFSLYDDSCPVYILGGLNGTPDNLPRLFLALITSALIFGLDALFFNRLFIRGCRSFVYFSN